MAYHYIGGDRDQLFLLPVSMRDWLAEGHLAWFVIEVVERIATSGLHGRHPNDGVGRPAYDPDMMLALLFYAYATGSRSSRRIEASCRTDAAYRVICGDVVPDHATIARFLVNHQETIREIFVAVLRLCAQAGLVSVGTIAIDGTKIGSDAALDRNHSGDWIRRRIETILAEAVETDADAHLQPGLGDIDHLPVELATPTGRLARLEAALAVIEAQDAAAAADAEQRTARARAEAAHGRKLPGRKPKDPHAALARAEADEAAVRLRTHAAARQRCTCNRPSSCAAIETTPKAAATITRATPHAPQPYNRPTSCDSLFWAVFSFHGCPVGAMVA